MPTKAYYAAHRHTIRGVTVQRLREEAIAETHRRRLLPAGDASRTASAGALIAHYGFWHTLAALPWTCPRCASALGVSPRAASHALTDCPSTAEEDPYGTS
jgi:hypothetical protein